MTKRKKKQKEPETVDGAFGPLGYDGEQREFVTENTEHNGGQDRELYSEGLY